MVPSIQGPLEPTRTTVLPVTWVQEAPNTFFPFGPQLILVSTACHQQGCEHKNEMVPEIRNTGCEAELQAER